MLRRGGNIIDKISCKNKYGSDNNKYVVELLKAIQSGWLPNIENGYSEEFYKEVQNNKDKYPDYLVGYIGFCLSFSAKFFGGYSRGKTNKGENRDYNLEAYRNLKKQAPNLQGIKFKTCDFRDIKDTKNYVIYCDIPYRNTTQYLTSKDFPYEEFYEWCKEKSKNNIVLVSEYWMPKEFECIWQKEIKVSIDSNRKANDINNNRTERLFICKGK